MRGDIWLPGLPQDDGVDHGLLSLFTGCALHRTYGSWPGDYSVIKNNGLCHVLIGQEYGQWVQFIGLDRVQWHCGSNWWGPGIEFTGVNEEPLTDWQVAAGRHVILSMAYILGIALNYSDGTDGWAPTPIYGFHAHNGIIPDGGGSQHTNLVTMSDWARMMADPNPPPLPTPPPPLEEDMLVHEQVVDSHGNTHLFVIGNDRSLYWKYQVKGEYGDWYPHDGGYTNLGGSFDSVPVATHVYDDAQQVGVVTVTVRHTNHQMWSRRYFDNGGGWQDWIPLGGGIINP